MEYYYKLLYLLCCFHFLNSQTAPSTGLYFTLNGVIYLPGDTVVISDIGPQPLVDRSDPGSTLICITTNVNTACCRASDNNGMTTATAGAVGEWRYPNGTLVPRASEATAVDFARFGYTHQVRLGMEFPDSTPPLGVYRCEVPGVLIGVVVVANITLTVAAPSAPTLISATPQTTTISLAWTQPPGDVVDSYTISYTKTTDQCTGTVDFTSSGSMPGINGTMRSYIVTNLEEDSEYNITVTAINGAGGATSTILTTRIPAGAPSLPPVLRVTSATPTTISIAWDEIPCLMRNGMIFRYIVSFCQVSVTNCQSFTIVTDVSNRTLTFNNLIPRSSYNIAIRADSQDLVTFILYAGSFSQVTADTAASQDLEFFLDGVFYPPNVALDLTDIGVDGDSLRCFTPLILCCRGDDNPNGGAQGNWRYPDGFFVPSRNTGVDISRTRESSSIFLQRDNNAMFPTGVYTCEIPDNNTTTRKLDVYLYTGQLTSLNVTLAYDVSAMHWRCTVRGGLVDSYTWMRGDVEISASDSLYNQTLTITNRSAVTTELLLFTVDNSSLLGSFTCNITDGNGRISMVSQLLEIIAPISVTVSTSTSLFSAGDSTSLTCIIILANDLIIGTSLEVNWTLPDNSVRMAGGSSDATLTGSDTFYDSVLTIPTLSLSLAGSYICSAMVTSTLPLTTNSEAVMNSAVVTVQAEAPSSVVIVTPSQSLLTGDSISLQCNIMLMSGLATGTSVEVTWSLPNNSSVIAGSTGDATLVGGGTAYTSNLTIPSLVASHAGVFNCHARVTSTLSYINSSDIVADSTTVAIQTPSAPSIHISTAGSNTAGEVYSLTCDVSLSQNFRQSPVIEWVGPDGNVIDNTTLRDVSLTSSSPSTTMTLLFNPLRTSHRGVYWCRATLTDMGNYSIMSNLSVTISIEDPPIMTIAYIKGFPTDSNFFRGLQLNLTCFLNITFSEYEDSVNFSVSMMWTKTNGTIVGNNRLMVIGAYQVTPLFYQSILVFNSLDKTMDEGAYICNIDVSVYRGQSTINIQKSVTRSLSVPTLFFQLQLSDVINCETWRTTDARDKNQDIADGITNIVSSSCGCDFTSDRLTDSVFLCSSSSPNSVTYQAQLHGSPQANADELLNIIENEFLSNRQNIRVQFVLLQVDNFCVVSSGTESPCEEPQLSSNSNTAIIVGVVVALLAVVIIAAIVVATILLIVNIKKKKYQFKSSNLPRENNTILRNYSASISHDYDYIDGFSNPHRLRSKSENIETSACPAYKTSVISNPIPELESSDDYM